MSKKNKERLPHQTTAVGVKESVGDHIFNIINTIVMLIVCLVILYPLWYVIVASFTDPSITNSGAFLIWPIDFYMGKPLIIPCCGAAIGTTLCTLWWALWSLWFAPSPAPTPCPAMTWLDVVR